MVTTRNGNQVVWYFVLFSFLLLVIAAGINYGHFIKSVIQIVRSPESAAYSYDYFRGLGFYFIVFLSWFLITICGSLFGFYFSKHKQLPKQQNGFLFVLIMSLILLVLYCSYFYVLINSF